MMNERTVEGLMQAMNTMKNGECPPIISIGCRVTNDSEDYCKNKKCWADFVIGVLKEEIRFDGQKTTREYNNHNINLH